MTNTKEQRLHYDYCDYETKADVLQNLDQQIVVLKPSGPVLLVAVLRPAVGQEVEFKLGDNTARSGRDLGFRFVALWLCG